MTPAEQLAAARGNVVGPYVPATEALLVGWVGPINIARGAGDPPSAYLDGVWVLSAGQIIDERVWYGVGDDHKRTDDVRIFLDLRRPEVRDLLVRRGAPAWARDVAPALWVWATTGDVLDAFGMWKDPNHAAKLTYDNGWPSGHRASRRGVDHVLEVGSLYLARHEYVSGWKLRAHPRDAWKPETASGPETGPEGMACADVAALSRGCILEEPDGWLLPLSDGGIGFWPREGA